MLLPSVWRERIRPLLEFWEAAQLRAVSRALKASVEEWPMPLGEWPRPPYIKTPKVLEAVLTCFPATESVEVSFDDELSSPETSRLVEILKVHPGTLKRFRVDPYEGKYFLATAVQAGALPNLTYFHFFLDFPKYQQILSEGMLEHLEEVCVTIDLRCAGEQKEPSVLRHLRRLPHLRRLSLVWCAVGMTTFPPFIPPSLKSLSLCIGSSYALERLLLELPSMLQASGASLEAITVRHPLDFDVSELEERWKELGEELEIKRTRFTLAEATLEL
jgi:hypothetical protein